MTEPVAELYQALADGLRRSFQRFGARPEEAEDLVGETFLRLLQSTREVAEIDDLGGWLHRTARNVWIDQRRRPSGEDLIEEPAAETSEAGLVEEVTTWLAPAIAALEDPLTRQILERTELGRERQTAVAEDLEMGLSTLKSRVQRGRAQLRRDLERCCAFAFDRRGGLLDATRRSPGAGNEDCCS